MEKRKVGIIVVGQGCEGRIAARHILINALRQLESKDLNFCASEIPEIKVKSLPILDFKTDFIDQYIEPKASKYIGKPKNNYRK